MTTPTQIMTQPVPWKGMLLQGSSSTAYQLPTPAVTDPVAADATAPSTTNRFIMPKGHASLLQFAFLAANADSGDFDVLIFGMSRLDDDGLYLNSLIAELRCTLGAQNNLPGGSLNTDWKAVDSISKLVGPDSVVIHNLDNQLAVATVDPGPHEYIGVTFKALNSQNMNGLYRKF